jgi:hypothetical protein
MTVTMGTLNHAIQDAKDLGVYARTEDERNAAQRVLNTLGLLRQDRIDRANAAIRDILDFADREPDLWAHLPGEAPGDREPPPCRTGGPRMTVCSECKRSRGHRPGCSLADVPKNVRNLGICDECGWFGDHKPDCSKYSVVIPVPDAGHRLQAVIARGMPSERAAAEGLVTTHYYGDGCNPEHVEPLTQEWRDRPVNLGMVSDAVMVSRALYEGEIRQAYADGYRDGMVHLAEEVRNALKGVGDE